MVVAHEVDFTHPNRDDSFSLHEPQDAIDGFLERRVRLAPWGGPARRLVAGIVVALELHRGDVVHRSHQKVEQRKEEIFLLASPDQLGDETGKTEYFKLPASCLCNECGDI